MIEIVKMEYKGAEVIQKTLDFCNTKYIIYLCGSKAR